MKYCCFSFLFLVAFAACALAGERCDIVFDNALNEEIIAIRVRYATPYEEPRASSSNVFLAAGGDYRIGVQGTIRPEVIIFDLADKSYYFRDLSALDPDSFMRLSVAHADGRPVLRRLDADDDNQAVTIGEELDFLTASNRPNAVDRNDLTALDSWEDVNQLVEDTVNNAGEELGALESRDVEAGPIWNQEHALARCPEAISEWNEANDRNARWTGHWNTTVPGKMSVCNCVEGTAGLSETLFKEDEDWGTTWYFPVYWEKWHGAARVQAMDKNAPEEGVGFDLKFSLDDADIAEMLDTLLSDLRVDGFRPWSFQLRHRDEENGEPRELEIPLSENDGDKYDHQEKLQELLFAAYADSSLIEAVITWVKEETFDKAKAGEEPPLAQGVMTMFSTGTFEAIFIPDGRWLAQ